MPVEPVYSGARRNPTTNRSNHLACRSRTPQIGVLNCTYQAGIDVFTLVQSPYNKDGKELEEIDIMKAHQNQSENTNQDLVILTFLPGPDRKRTHSPYRYRLTYRDT